MSEAQRAGVPAKPAPRRQARGERRIEQLLDAAGRVFATSGYAGASTNAIAREAQVSPGTLYQFFPNKEALAIELGHRYHRRLRAAHNGAFTPENAMLPLAGMLDAVLDPMIEFCAANPAFGVLLDGVDSPGDVAEEHEALHVTVLASTKDLLRLRAPHLADVEADQAATMAFAVFKAGLDLLIAQEEGPARDAYTVELKRVLYGYLAPIVGVDAVAPAPAPDAT
jgi:AcrR family transcriptional regulator